MTALRALLGGDWSSCYCLGWDKLAHRIAPGQFVTDRLTDLGVLVAGPEIVSERLLGEIEEPTGKGPSASSSRDSN